MTGMLFSLDQANSFSWKAEMTFALFYVDKAMVEGILKIHIHNNS